MAGAEQQTNISIGVNASQFTDGMKSATAAAQQFESSIDQLTNTTQKTAQQVTMTAASYQKLVQSLDPAARSAALYAAAETKIQQAVAAGLTTRDQANKLLDLAGQKYNTVANQATQAAKAQADAASKALTQQTASFKQLEAAIDPAAAKKQQLAATETQLNAAVKAGLVSQDRANELLEMTKASGGHAEEGLAGVTREFIVMGHEAMNGNFSRIPGSLVVLTERSGTLTKIVEGASSVFERIGVVGAIGIAGLIASLVILTKSAESGQRAMVGLTNTLSKFGGDSGGTAQTIRAAAKDLAASTSLGTQEASDALKTLAENPNFARTKQNFEETAKAAQKFSIGFEESLQQSAERINAVFADPVAAALKYAQQQIAGFDDAFHRHIQDLVNQGQKVQAANEVYAKLVDAFKKVNTEGTPLQAAMKKLSETLTAVGQGAGSASTGIGTGLTNALAGVVNGATAAIKALDELLTWLDKIGIGSTAQGGLVIAAFGLMLSPVRSMISAVIELVGWLGKLALVQLPAWIAGLGTASRGVAAAVAAGEAATAGGAAVAGGVATAAGGATAGAVVGEAGVIAMLGGAAGIAAIVTAVLATGAVAAIIAYFNKSGQASFRDQASAAGFQQYKTGTGLLAENPRYYNQRTGEDLSTEQMNQRLLGQTLADSFGTRMDAWLAKSIPTFFGGRTETGATPPTGGQITLNPLTNIPPAGQQYAPLFAASEQKYGLPAGTLAGIASIETGGTFDPNAANKKSSARGMMQILDSTATNPGYGITPIKPEDRFNPAISIDFAGQLLSKVAAANGGSLDKAIQVYSGGGYAPGAGLKGVTLGPQAANSNVKVGQAPFTVQTQLEQAQTSILGQPGDNAAQVAALQKQIDNLEKLKQAAGLTSEQIGAFDEQERKLREQIEALKTPFDRTIQQQQDQLKADQELNPALKQVTEATIAYHNAQKAQGRADDPTEIARIQQGVLQQLAAQYKGLISGGEEEAQSQQRLAAAWDVGSAAAEHQTNVEKARQAVSGSALVQTKEQAAATELYAQKLDKAAEAAKHMQAAQQLLQAQSQGRLIDVQEANLGGSATQQAVANAQAQAAEQAKLANYNPQDTAKLVSQAGANAAKTVNVDREKQAWATVDGAASSAINDIGNGLEQVLSTGKWSDFASAAKQALSEISKMLIELTLLNPLKNLLTGGRANAPSLFDLFNGTGNQNNPLANGGVLSGGQISGGGSSSGGFNAGGLLGSIGGAFSKGGLFGSEGALFGSGGIFGSGAGAGGLASSSSIADAAALSDAAPLVGSIGSSVAPVLATPLIALEAHVGGIAGQIGGNMRSGLPPEAFAGAARYHTGGLANDNTLPPQFAADEIPAVLRRNELVMTQAQQRAVSGRLNQANMKQPIINQHFNISTPDADSFRSSKSQIQVEMARAMARASRKM